MSGEETNPLCLFGVSSVSLFPVISTCVGVGMNLKKISAGSWNMYWKKREGSLGSLCTGLQLGCLDFYSYGSSLAYSRGCSEKED